MISQTKALELLSKFTSKDPARPLFTCVQALENRMVATDTHVLATLVTTYRPAKPSYDLINVNPVPGGDIDGKYPDYTKVLVSEELPVVQLSFDTHTDRVNPFRYWKDIFTLAKKLTKRASCSYLMIEMHDKALWCYFAGDKQMGVKARLAQVETERENLVAAYDPDYLIKICDVLISYDVRDINLRFTAAKNPIMQFEIPEGDKCVGQIILTPVNYGLDGLNPRPTDLFYRENKEVQG